MGYRSEVKIVAGKKAAAEIRAVIKKYDSPLTEVGTNKRGDTLFACDWVKWYEDDTDFPEVSAVMDVVNKYMSLPASESSKDTGIEYCRVGEDYGDNDYQANGDGYGYLSVAVKCYEEEGFKPKPKPKAKAKGKKAK
jgi:hypothetical protein